MFDAYSAAVATVTDHVRATVAKDPADTDFVFRQATRAKALDATRGMLPAASLSNVGIYGTGQAFEALLLRLRAHPLPEARAYAELMLEELRKVIPSFLRRVDVARARRTVDASTWRRRASQTAALVDELFAAEPVDEAADGHARRLRSRRRGQVAGGDLLSARAAAGDAAARPGAQARRRRAPVA